MPSPNDMTARPGVPHRSEVEIKRATTLAEALQIMAEGAAEGKPWMPLAGGTDLMVWITQRRLVPERVLDLWAVDGLRGITETESDFTFGALTTYAEVMEHAEVQAFLPAMVEAARWCGARQIQSRGTLGGNIAGGSPAGDALPLLMAWGAELTLVSTRGTRVVPFTEFYTGYRQNLLEADELILRISVPKLKPNAYQVFRKVGTRMAQSISKVMMAFHGNVDDDGIVTDLGIAFGSVGPTPLRMEKTEKLVIGQKLSDALIAEARESILAEITPIDDVRSTEDYRRQVSGNLAARALRHLKG